MTGGRLRRALLVRRRARRRSASPTATASPTSTSPRRSTSIARSGTLATVTAVQPPGRFGALEVEGDRVRGFHEKPRGDGGWINGGFFVLSPEVRPLPRATTTRSGRTSRSPRLARDGRAAPAYEHLGFWQRDGHAPRQAPARGALGERRSALEDVGVDPDFWRGRRVLLTGHTGFKGSWLALWLEQLGAEVHGLRGRDPHRRRRCSSCARVGEGVRSLDGDVRDRAAVERAIADVAARGRDPHGGAVARARARSRARSRHTRRT